ncbi:MAG: NAD-binding protein [Deltaproteobacteria bacterium]|nr:NAD-binding protein [Deltaproteobacteria bacterium]
MSLAAKRPLRERVAQVLNHPKVELGIVALIFISVLGLLVELALPVGSGARRTLQNVSDALTLVFAVELALRAWLAPHRGRFFRRHLLDLIALLPLFRPLRLLRVLLLLRLFRAGTLLSRRMSVYGGLFAGTSNEVTALITLTLTITLIGAVTVHVFPEIVRLDAQGLEGGLWFAVFTLVGGEPLGGVPQTQLGRAVSLALMVGGMTTFGVFVGTVSAGMMAVLGKRMEIAEMELDDLSEHIVVCGWNQAGPALVQEFFSAMHEPHRALVLLTEQDKLPANFPTAGVKMELVYHLKGDWTRVDLLEKAGVRRASTAILLDDNLSPRPPSDRDARTVLAALTIERLAPEVFCCAQLNSDMHEGLLRMSGVEEIVIGDWYTGVILASVGRNQGLVAVLSDILTAQRGNAFHKVGCPKPWIGRTVGEASADLKRDHEAILVSLERKGAGKRHHRDVMVNPPSAEVIREGDVLVVISRNPIHLGA